MSKTPFVLFSTLAVVVLFSMVLFYVEVSGQTPPIEEQQEATNRHVVTVTNYYVSSDDPNDFISILPGSTSEIVVGSHYHHYRVGMASVRQDLPSGSPEGLFGYLPEGDNAEGSVLGVSKAEVMDETTFRVIVDASQTQRGDNFILYFTTVGKAVTDYRWPNWPPTAGTPRSFQIHLHIGESLEEYVQALKG